MVAAFVEGISLPRAELAVARTAASRHTDESSLLLLRVAPSRDPEVQTLVRTELARRFSPDRLREARAMMDREALGDAALRDGRFAEARGAYAEALERAGRLGLRDDLLRLSAARASLSSGHSAEGHALLAALVAEPDTHPHHRGQARSALRATEGGRPLRATPASLTVSATVGGGPLRPWPGRFFARRVEIVNGSEQHVPGGVWFHGLRLVWIFRDLDTGEHYRYGAGQSPLQTFLPAGGIAPGETASLVVIGATPPVTGRYRPELVLTTRRWFPSDGSRLATLPAVALGVDR
jgi:hypothetical protein